MKNLWLVALVLVTACENKAETQPSDGDDAEKQEAESVEEEHIPGEEEAFTPLETTLTFRAPDGLEVSADLHEIGENQPYIILCHQAGFSRGEYAKTHIWFNALGLNTFALDQRSGKEANGVLNETAQRAEELELPNSYLDAEQDIRTAIQFVSDQLATADKPIYLVGSSYSASLVLKIAADTSFEYHDQIEAVLSFSPGEYLKGVDLSNSLGSISCPVFATSSRDEIDQVAGVTAQINPELLTHFKPEEESVHGSRALWEAYSGYEACRQAVVDFMSR